MKRISQLNCILRLPLLFGRKFQILKKVSSEPKSFAVSLSLSIEEARLVAQGICCIGYLVNYPLYDCRDQKEKRQWINLCQMETMQPSETFFETNQKILSQVSELGLCYPSIKFGKIKYPSNKVKGFDVFSVIRQKYEVDFLIGKLLEVFYFPSVLVFLANSFEKRFLGSFFLSMCFQSLHIKSIIYRRVLSYVRLQ